MWWNKERGPDLSGMQAAAMNISVSASQIYGGHERQREKHLSKRLQELKTPPALLGLSGDAQSTGREILFFL